MLDSKHKKYIDDLCDILVAKFPVPQDQVDQITVALTYKFMNDMDKESVSFGGEKSFFLGDWSKYSWDHLFDAKTTGDERKEIYKYVVENLELNPNLPPLFRDIFSNPPNPFNDTRKLFDFLKIINNFSYENSETLGNAYEYLLSKTGAQGKLGQFRTPRHIIDFIVDIVDPKSTESILDPACGTAGFLVSAFKHIKIKEEQISAEKLLTLSKNLVGYDIEPKMIRISLLNLFLQGFQTPKILEQDLLSDDLFWNDYYDVMLANPPFFTPKGGITPHNGFALDSKRAEIHFLDYIQSHIKPDGRAGVIVPDGILSKNEKAYKTIRKTIIESSLIGIVSLPAGVFLPYSGVKTSILFLDKKIAKETDQIFFGVIKNDGYALSNNRDPIEKNDIPKVKDHILKKKDANDDFLYVSKEKILKEDTFFLTWNTYQETKTFNTKYPLVPILEVHEVVTPITKVKKKDFLTKGKYPIIDQSKDDVAGYWDRDQDKMSFDNPIVIFGDHTRSVKYIDFDFVAGADGIKILKPNEKILPKFFYYLLKTLEILDLGYNRHYKELKTKEIPLPPLEVQKEIIDELEGYQKIIDGCKQVVENYKPIIDIDPSWKTVCLGEICSLKTGGTPKSTKKEYYENGTIPWLVSGDIHSEEIFDCDGRITQEGLESSNAKLLPKDSVMIALNGQGKTRGTVAVLRFEATCNQSLVSILPNDEETLLVEYLFVCLRGMYKAIRNLTGDKQRSGLNMPIIKKIKIPMAPINIQKEIVQKIEEERKVIEGNKKLIETYTQKIQDRINKVWGENQS